MVRFYFNLFFCIVLLSCQDNKVISKTSAGKVHLDSTIVIDSPRLLPDTARQPATINSIQKLALTSNALQIVDGVTGSTREIAFGMPDDQLVQLLSNVLNSSPISEGVNSECGAGPLKMVMWKNGLSLVFKETKKGNDNWVFAGWFAGRPTIRMDKLTTMAGVGVGSSVAELQSAYVIETSKTSLGVEFSAKSGFYGLLSGASDKDTIEVMWSGTSCNFR